MARVFGYLFALVVGLTIAVAIWRSLESTRRADQDTPAARLEATAPPAAPRAFGMRPDSQCAGAPAYQEAAARNAASVSALSWAPFGRSEVGWLTYWPLIANEIGSNCGPGTAEFAERLAAWQQAHDMTPDGVLTPEVFEPMRIAWLRRLPSIAGRGDSICEAPPPISALGLATDAESYGGKTIHLHPGALDAYRRMVRAARQEVPGLQETPEMLVIFSGFRAPADDDASCAAKGNCDGVVRSRSCSPHRTGMAMDIVMGAAPGHRIDSSADPNRLHMSQTPAYRWLVANAGRFGFANYPFEPWHWEWTGQAPAERKAASSP